MCMVHCLVYVQCEWKASIVKGVVTSAITTAMIAVHVAVCCTRSRVV